VYTNNTCVTHRQQAFEFDMFRAADLAANGPHNTTMPYTARNQAYLGIEFQFGGWNHTQATTHGVDVGGSVHPEMERPAVAMAARRLLGLAD
jgi:hypothetical protein